MQRFETEIQFLIDETESTMFDIERIIFTDRYKLTKKHSSILSVQSIAMIYALWERFIQKSFQRYIEEIEDSDAKFCDYVDSLRIFHLENEFKQLREYPVRENNKIKFIDKLSAFFAKDKHSLYRAVNTESNVGFEVLNKIMLVFSLKSFPENWEGYSKPNNNLKELLNNFLRYRNGISHGGDISSEEKVTQEVFSKYRRLVLDLMYGISEKMNHGLSRKTYLKCN